MIKPRRIINVAIKTVFISLLLLIAIYSFVQTAAFINALYGIAALALAGFVLTSDFVADMD